MGLFKNLFGAKPKATKAKTPAAPAKDSTRATLIAEALRIQRAQGAVVRQTLSKAIGDLGKAGPKLLRDQDALTRLMELIQTRQTLNGLAADAPKPGPGSAKSRGTRH